MKKWIRLIYRVFVFIYELNIFKTIYVNFKFLPINQSIRFPFFVFGKLKVKSFTGEVLFLNKPSLGMVLIGRDLDGFPTTNLPIHLEIDGVIKIHGPLLISGGVNITVWRGTVEFEKYVRIGSGVILKCIEYIKIGENTAITANCTIMDTEVHYIYNCENNLVKKNFAKIIIGKNCWINPNTIISKGTILPDGVITTRNTYLNKDYTDLGIDFLLSGIPGHIIKTNVKRIFSYSLEKEINNFFFNHVDEEHFYIDDELLHSSEANNAIYLSSFFNKKRFML
jgi:Acetyltransferase (isoleucine patch superfamily)